MTKKNSQPIDFKIIFCLFCHIYIESVILGQPKRKGLQ